MVKKSPSFHYVFGDRGLDPFPFANIYRNSRVYARPNNTTFFLCLFICSGRRKKTTFYGHVPNLPPLSILLTYRIKVGAILGEIGEGGGRATGKGREGEVMEMLLYYLIYVSEYSASFKRKTKTTDFFNY